MIKYLSFLLLFFSGSVWAETEILWYGASNGCNIKGHSTPQSAAKACGYLDRKGWKLEKRGEFTYEMAWYNEDGSFYKWTGSMVLGRKKTCEHKQLYNWEDPFKAQKNPNLSKSQKQFYENIFLIYSNKKEIVDKMKSGKPLTRCSNNCLIEDHHIRTLEMNNGEYMIATNRYRTGAVCVGEGTDYFDITGDDVVSDDDVDLPDGDNGGGEDEPPPEKPDDGGDNGGDDGGDNGGNDTPDLPPDPPVDIYRPCPENRGSYKNGDIASCARFPPRVVPKEERKPRDNTPDGGGNNGGQGGSDGAGQNGGGNSDGGDDGCKFGKKPDGSCVKEGSGGSGGGGGGGHGGSGGSGGNGDGGDDDADKGKGKGDDDSGKNHGGKGGDDEDDAGAGKGGKGRISGGNCAKKEAPVCKGDPVQCYIAKEQWRSACFAEQGRSEIGQRGDCKTGKKPVCKGDVATCYQIEMQFEATCAAQSSNELDTGGVAEGFGRDVTEGEIAAEIGVGDSPTKEGIAKQFRKEEDISSWVNKFDDRGFLGSRQCMPAQEYSVGGISFKIDWGYLCLFLQYVGHFLTAMGYFIGFRIVSGGFDK